MSSYAYFNGKFGKKEDINIPLSDRSIFFGDAVYDVAIGCYDRIMWEDDHIDRFLLNAEILGFDHSLNKGYLSSLLREIAVKSMIDRYMIYFQLSRNLKNRCHSSYGSTTNLLITIDPLTIDKAPSSMKLITMPDVRHGLCNIKTVNLLPAVLSIAEAEKSGCDEAIFIKNNAITECSKSNILIIKQGRVITHPKSSHILPGIVRAHILSACKVLGIPFEERPFTKEELFFADEILISSTTKLVKYASQIDSLSVGGGATEIVSEIYNYLYSEYPICNTL